MAKVPKWWGDSIEKLFKNKVHHVQVTDIQYLAPQLAKVRFNGNFSNGIFRAGHLVEFRITENEFRHYTVSGFGNNFCEVIFYLHDKGPGSRWAQTLRVDDQLKLLGPGGSMKVHPEYNRHVIFGDETCIGLMSCMEHAITSAEKSVISIVEVAEGHEEWVQFAGKEAVFVHSSLTHPGQAAIDLMNRNDFWHTTDDIFFYLAGRLKSIRALKEFLLSKGVSPRQIKAEPYWNEGKSGL